MEMGGLVSKRKRDGAAEGGHADGSAAQAPQVDSQVGTDQEPRAVKQAKTEPTTSRSAAEHKPTNASQEQAVENEHKGDDSGLVHAKYLILGGGVSAGYAAKTFVELGSDKGEVVIVSAESVPPYERPALSKGYMKAEDPPRPPGFSTSSGTGGPKQDNEWYESNGIKLMLDTKVNSIDMKACVATTDQDHRIQYDTLIIATGCKPFVIDKFVKAEPGDMMYLRSVEDARAIYDNVAALPENSTVAVIGGGFIGVEIATAICDRPVKIHVISDTEKILARAVPPEAATVYQQAMQDKSIELHLGVRASELTREGAKVTGIKLQDGTEVKCDRIIAGTGATPAAELFKEQLPMRKDGSIIVDSNFKTGTPNVYAVGDVAAFPVEEGSEELTRIEHVHHARESAMHAVRHIMGKAEAGYKFLPYFYSRFLQFSWKLYGHQQGECHLFGTFEVGQRFGAVWVSDGHVVGVYMESPRDEDVTAMQDVAKGRPAVADNDELESFVQDKFGLSLANTQ